jgi:hypothetical protein
VSGNDAPGISMRTPDAGISEWSRKRRAFERPSHFHANAHDRDMPEMLDSFLARVETSDVDDTAPVPIQIVLLTIDSSVWSGEDERIVHQPVELVYITRELRSPQRRLALT